MPRNGSGNYSLPPVYLATPGTTVRSEQHNIPLQDLAQSMTDSLPRNGSAPMTGNLPMGGRRITGLGSPTSNGDAMSRAAVNAALDAYTPLAGSLQYAAPGLAGRSDAGAGGGRVIFLGAGVEFVSGTLRAQIGAGLSFVAGAITAAVARIASVAEAQAGTDNAGAMTALRTRQAFNAEGAAPVFACRAWGSFNGNSGSVGKRGSGGNFNTVTRTAVGRYEITFATPMQDVNYCVQVSSSNPDSSIEVQAATIAVNGFSIQCNSGVTDADASHVFFTVFR